MGLVACLAEVAVGVLWSGVVSAVVGVAEVPVVVLGDWPAALGAGERLASVEPRLVVGSALGVRVVVPALAWPASLGLVLSCVGGAPP